MFDFLRKKSDVVRFKAMGHTLAFSDQPTSAARKYVLRDLRKDAYRLRGIMFRPGDIVVDVGGHVGMFSIFIAKLRPFVKVYAFEPVPENCAHFRSNLERNRVSNVELIPSAVTKDGRDLPITVALASNSGGGTAHARVLGQPGHITHRVQSITLQQVFDRYDIRACKLLKIDCEGSEHEVLLNFSYLDRVEFLRGEFHMNSTLREQGYTIERLAAHCRRSIKPENVDYVTCTMTE
jgi:FkbM family methyltransferase